MIELEHLAYLIANSDTLEEFITKVLEKYPQFIALCAHYEAMKLNAE